MSQEHGILISSPCMDKHHEACAGAVWDELSNSARKCGCRCHKK